jgi:two-component system sensor histidine kinase/response regulator
MKKNSTANILIVDDNIKNLQVLGNALYSSGYLISVAKSGKQALQLIEKNLPDLILLDIMMPEMDGYETCKQLKASPSTAQIPVIFLTAKNETEDLIRGFQSGGVDYITKPFNREELLVRVKTHIELKKSRETILEQSKQLQKLNAAKDKLFAVISHDLRDPIGTLEASLKILKDDPEFLKQHLDELINMTSDTKTMMEDLLNWSKNQQAAISITPKRIDLHELIKQAIKLFKGKADAKNITFEWKSSTALWATADREMIFTVLRNLISNSIKFTHPEGTIAISTRHTENNIEVSVTDTGIGMSESTIAKILTPQAFHSTFGTKGEKGTGIGLQICRDFINYNNGKLKIQSVPNQGSQFSFTLPCNEKNPELTTKKQPTNSKKKIPL